jgi:uncharacterized membrane protein YbhN (UPF0104 family)
VSSFRRDPSPGKDPVKRKIPQPGAPSGAGRRSLRGLPRRGRHESDIHAARASRQLLHGLISLVVLVAIVVGLLVAIPGLHGVAKVVERMPLGWVAAAIGFEILSCVCYIIAFLQVFERAPVRFGARVALSELAFNAAVSLGGAGSVAVGAWLLVERGASPSRVAERSAVLFLLTSAINVITFVLAGLALLTGIASGSQDLLLTALPAGVGTLVLIFFLALPGIIDRGLTRRLPRAVRVVLETTATSIRETRRLLLSRDWRIVGAIGYLWFDIAVLIACFAAIGQPPPVAALVLAYQIAYLSNFIPIPGGIGVLDGSMVGALVLYGAKATDAAAATLVYHAISLWVPATWGTIAFLLLRRNRHQPLTLRPPREERRSLWPPEAPWQRLRRYRDENAEHQDVPVE